MKTRSRRLAALAVRIVPLTAVLVVAQQASVVLADGPRIL